MGGRQEKVLGDGKERCNGCWNLCFWGKSETAMKKHYAGNILDQRKAWACR